MRLRGDCSSMLRVDYDAVGNLHTITNPLHHTTTVAYDAGGRLTHSTDPLGIVTCREYDAANNVIAVVRHCVPGDMATDNQNVCTTLDYDAIGRVVAVVAPHGQRTDYSYRNGHLETITLW